MDNPLLGKSKEEVINWIEEWSKEVAERRLGEKERTLEVDSDV